MSYLVLTDLTEIAARFAHADLCRWLIEKGARADAVEIRSGRWVDYTRHELCFKVILTFSRTPLHMITSISRSDSKASCDTIRVLVEYGQSDTMAGMPRYDPTWRGITPLEFYHSSLEGFQNLLNQDHSIIDFKDSE